MKTLVIIRHGRKDGELIAKDQIAEIISRGITGLDELVMDHNGPILFHYGSKFVRTRQTIKAFEDHLDITMNYNFGGYLLADRRLGNEEMFKRFMSDAKIKAEAEKTNWYSAFKVGDPQFLKETQKGLLEASEQTFASSPENSLIISAGHSPLTEWLVYKIDKRKLVPRDIKLKELTGFVITENSGEMRIEDTIGFDL